MVSPFSTGGGAPPSSIKFLTTSNVRCSSEHLVCFQNVSVIVLVAPLKDNLPVLAATIAMGEPASAAIDFDPALHVNIRSFFFPGFDTTVAATYSAGRKYIFLSRICWHICVCER